MTTTRSTYLKAIAIAFALVSALAVAHSAWVARTHSVYVGTVASVQTPAAIAAPVASVTPDASAETSPDAATSPSAVIPPCAVETAEDLRGGQVCRWDAGTSGNGRGQSFNAYAYDDATLGLVIMYVYDNGDATYSTQNGDDTGELLEVGDGWSPPVDSTEAPDFVNDFSWDADTASDI